MNFPTDLEQIHRRVEQADPLAYGRTRNFLDGDVTYLSPYISRGVISTKQIMENVLARGYEPKQIEKFLQELAWRDYWQQVWLAKQELINEDLKRTQPDVEHHHIPSAIVTASTGVHAIDQGISRLYETGYMHNHLRMYVGAIACNMGKSHWKLPAQWMYYHLLDGDWASNALSWQWVAGANSNKKYVANQDNINKYCSTDQKGTFLDITYEAFESLEVPPTLEPTTTLNLTTPLPTTDNLELDDDLPFMLYNWYNLDPRWNDGIPANRVLLLEPSVFERYPISAKSVDFCLQLAENIQDIQVFVGEFSELMMLIKNQPVHFKEHPLNKHYQGIEEPRDWMFSITGYFPSFFGFWNKCKKSLK